MDGRFAGGFCDFGCAEGGFLVVNRGEFVVKTWLKSARKLAAKIFHFSEVYFWWFCFGKTANTWG